VLLEDHAFIPSSIDTFLPILQQRFPTSIITVLPSHQFLLPGFIDCHTHASQYGCIGNGPHTSSLHWLEHVSLAEEARYHNPIYARRIYHQCILRHLSMGTTTACYIATLHVETSWLLAILMDTLGQRGLVGKVCMDDSLRSDYVETTLGSLHVRF
jgi:guanine deaminase